MNRRAEDKGQPSLVSQFHELERQIKSLMKRWLLTFMVGIIAMTLGMGLALIQVNAASDKRADRDFETLCSFVQSFALQRSITAASNARTFASTERLLLNIQFTVPGNEQIFIDLAREFEIAAREERIEARVTRAFAEGSCEDLSPNEREEAQ